MSGSEAGMMTTSREPFTMSMNQPQVHNMRVAYSADGTAVYKPVTPISPTYHSASGNGVNGGAEAAAGGGAVSMNMGNEALKKKRGRPRKYGPEGTMSLSLSPTNPSVAGTQPNNAGFSSPVGTGSAPFSGGSGSAASPISFKKARGRPPGSSNKPKLEPLGSPGAGFTPHVINVQAGEDVSSKIMSFAQNSTRAVCILSANGAISNVTLRQPSTSGGTVTYQGRFEILSLSGSFLLTEYGGQRSRTGGLSVSLSGSDGRVLGGSVAGLLTAASPVQVIVGSFIADGQKESKSAHQFEAVSSQPKFPAASGIPTGTSSSPSHGTHSESSGGPSSPLNQSTGACNNNNPQGMMSMPWK